MNPKDTVKNLAIIGTTGTGKTTLAVGLYATSTPAFTVSPIGDETRKYLEIRQTSIQKGFWPAATNESENFDLRLSLHAAGKETDIVFRDYMGERMEKDPSYIQEVIGKPKSAMILFNPGMPGGTCKKAAEEFLSIAKTLENAMETADSGFNPGIVAGQIKSIKSSLDRLNFLKDESGESSRNELVSECDSISSELEGWGRSTDSVSDSGLDRMAHLLRGMASKMDALKPIGLADPETRNRMIGNLKKIARHLKGNRCIAVAFVVTASDRLTTDLKDFRKDFESYASEVTNHLTNLRLNWKRFDVTVSGQLQDQNKPTLARGEDNTTHEPFLWLMACIKHHEFWRRIKVSAVAAAVLLAVAGTAFGGFVWSSRSKLARAETTFGKCLVALKASYAIHDEADIRTNAEFLKTNAFERLSAILPSDRARKEKLIALAREQKDLWDVRLLATEFALTTKQLNGKPADVPLDWFSKFDEKVAIAAPSFTNAVAELGALKDEWTNSRITLETVCQTAHFRDAVEKESKNLASAREADLDAPLAASLALLTDKNRKYALVTNRSELCAPLRSARTNAIARYVDSKTTWKKEDTTPPGNAQDIIRTIRKELKTALTSEEFANLDTIVEQRRQEALIAWENCQFPLRRKAQIDELKGAPDSPAIASALKASLSFLDDMDGLFPSIPETDRVAARTAIINARALAIGRYIDSKTRWRPEDDDPPGSVKDLHLQARTDLKGGLTTAEFDSLESKLTQHRDKARKEWDAYHFPKRATELETALSSAGPSPVGALRESLSFLGTMTNDYPTISRADFIRTKASLTLARKDALASYAQSLAGKWDVTGRNPPEFDGKKIRDTILTDAVVTDEEASAFDRDMEKRFQAAKTEWDKQQRKLLDDFDVGGDPETIVRNYGEFCDEWPNNPYLGDLSEKIDNALQEYFKKFISDYTELVFGSKGKSPVGHDQHPKQRMEEAQRLYNKFVGVCRALNGDGCKGTLILGKPSGKFAKLCCDKGGLADTERGIYSVFQQKLIITRIEALATLDENASSFLGLDLAVKFRTQRWNYSNASWETMGECSFVNMKSQTDSSESGNLPKSRNEKWVTLWTGTKEFLVNPYTMTRIDCSFEDRLTATFSMDVGDSFYWYPYLDSTSCECEWQMNLYHSAHNSTVGKLQLRVTAERNGPDFWTLAHEAGIKQ